MSMRTLSYVETDAEEWRLAVCQEWYSVWPEDTRIVTYIATGTGWKVKLFWDKPSRLAIPQGAY